MVAAPRHERVEPAAGLGLHVEVWPAPESADADGQGFLLVHGLASNAAMWRGLADRLSSLGHPVVAIDQRGHGLSDKPDGPYDIATFVADLSEVLNKVSLPAPVVVGQSMGGNVVVELAARHPGLVRGVACVDGGWIDLADRFSSWRECESALAPPAFEGRKAEELEALVRARYDDWPESAIAGFLANFEFRDDETVAPWLTRPRHMAILRSLWDHHPSQLYPSITVPVLLLPAVNPSQPEGWGQAVEKAAALLPDVRVRPMAGDHDLHAQYPEPMAELLHEWAETAL